MRSKTPPMGQRPTPIQKRRAGQRARRSYILVVTEDEKSSRYYLEDLGKILQLEEKGWILAVEQSSHTDPLGLFNHAKTLAETAFERYSYVFCVLDGDSYLKGGKHRSNFLQTIKVYETARIKRNDDISKTDAISLTPIISTPCFEVWLLLHFQQYVPPFQKNISSGRESFCKPAESMLDRYLGGTKSHGYEKGNRYPFDQTFWPNVADAIKNARQLSDDAQKTRQPNTPPGLSNPETQMYKLVECLMEKGKGSE